MDNTELKGLFSKLIIENGSNSYFAPRFINKLSAEEKTYLLNRGVANVGRDQQTSTGQFNLFELRFADVLD